MAIFNAIEKRLNKLGDAHIYWDSDEKHLTVSINPQSVRRSDVIALLKEFGYKYYDCGANGNKVMMTFVPEQKGVSESRKRNKLSINESQLKNLISEAIEEVLKESVRK